MRTPLTVRAAGPSPGGRQDDKDLDHVLRHWQHVLAELVDHGDRLDLVTQGDLPRLSAQVNEVAENVRQLTLKVAELGTSVSNVERSGTEPRDHLLSSIEAVETTLKASVAKLEERLTSIEQKLEGTDSLGGGPVGPILQDMVNLIALLSVRLLSVEQQGVDRLRRECVSLAQWLDEDFVRLLRQRADEHRPVQTRYDSLMALVTMATDTASELRADATKDQPGILLDELPLAGADPGRPLTESMADVLAFVDRLDEPDLRDSPLARSLRDQVGHVRDVLRDYADRGDEDEKRLFGELGARIEAEISRCPALAEVWQPE